MIIVLIRSQLTDWTGRLLKILATEDVIHEVGADSYTATATSDLLATPEGTG
jgi:hypothetical protein